MGVSDDTDRQVAIKLQHLSPTWVRWLDRELGRVKEHNGGFAELNVRFDHGKTGVMRWLCSFMPDQWRRDLN